MQATLTRARTPRISEGEPSNTGEPYTTTPYHEPAFTVDKSDGVSTVPLLYTGVHPQVAETAPVQVKADHAAITRLRTKNFFNEIRDLLRIDNAYRGVRDMDYFAEEALEKFSDNHVDVASKVQAFFGELVELVAEDNEYRGVYRDQRGCGQWSA